MSSGVRINLATNVLNSSVIWQLLNAFICTQYCFKGVAKDGAQELG